MPVSLGNNRYGCKYCGKEVGSLLETVGCELSHKVVYIDFLPEELNRLLQYIYIGDKDLLSDNIGQQLVKKLQKYKKQRVTRRENYE